MLEIKPDGPDRLPDDHPLAAHLDVYQWLTVLQEYLVAGADGIAMNSITDVAGILVGHHHRLDPDATMGAGWASGVTVVLTPPGTVGAVDVRGGAPGTRETDLLDPANSVRYVDAVLLAGGSAYGLAAADGVMRWLEEHDRGVAMERRSGADRAGRGDLRSGRSAPGATDPPPSSAMTPARRPAPTSPSARSAPGWGRARVC